MKARKAVRMVAGGFLAAALVLSSVFSSAARAGRGHERFSIRVPGVSVMMHQDDGEGERFSIRIPGVSVMHRDDDGEHAFAASRPNRTDREDREEGETRSANREIEAKVWSWGEHRVRVAVRTNPEADSIRRCLERGGGVRLVLHFGGRELADLGEIVPGRRYALDLDPSVLAERFHVKNIGQLKLGLRCVWPGERETQRERENAEERTRGNVAAGSEQSVDMGRFLVRERRPQDVLQAQSQVRTMAQRNLTTAQFHVIALCRSLGWRWVRLPSGKGICLARSRSRGSSNGNSVNGTTTP
ncbi:hypothetical protein [Thermosulfurimonas sp. F29]|uniref:hypothetical protein n=1 Tax=Thermosulfurimonas sp. F29 TaxID=2867247 RepID=UPI001C83EAA1|nr:hypothetical protein [Thermosulfurimonas sp. F29]MBX6423419.1 hypothetical protein [Thermosulfurimonas sp. F29]